MQEGTSMLGLRLKRLEPFRSFKAFKRFKTVNTRPAAYFRSSQPLLNGEFKQA